MRATWIRCALLAATLNAVACGSEEPTTRVSLNQSRLEGSFRQGDGFQGFEVLATLDPLPAGDLYFEVVDDGGAFTGVAAAPTSTANVFQAWLTASCVLSPGLHQGTVSLRLCHDVACTRPIKLSGGSLAYQLDVTPGMVLSGSIDGVPTRGPVATCGYSHFVTNPGQVVRLDSPAPVAWLQDFLYSSGRPSVADVVVTETSWSATVLAEPYPNDALYPGAYVGIVRVRAIPLGDATLDQEVEFEVRIP